MARRYRNPEMEATQPPTVPQSPNYENAVQTQAVGITFPWANPKILDSATPPGVSPQPPYFRTVTQAFPANRDTTKQCKFPFGLVLRPALVESVEEIDHSQDKVPRCFNCHGYLCPNCKVSNDGKTWNCGICGKPNEITDKTHIPFGSQPEFSLSVYDVIAPQIISKIRSEPLFLFLIDMSYPTYSIGFTSQFLSSIKAAFHQFPDKYHIGLMTMSTHVSIFDLQTCTEYVIPDVTDPPFSIKFTNLFPLKPNCSESFLSIIDSLLNTVPSESVHGHCLGSAYLLANKLLNGNGGIIISGFTRMPQYGIHLLRPRAATDESSLLKSPPDGSGKFYRDVAISLNNANVSVHVFTAGAEYSDISTLAIPSGLTCGQIHHYEDFNEFQRQKMNSEIYHTLTNKYLYDCTLRLRCTNGLKVFRQHTNCILRNTLISFPIISKEDSITFEIEIQGNLPKNITFQVGMIYTDINSRRMIRVFTFNCITTTNLYDVYRYINESSLINLITKRFISLTLSKGINTSQLNIDISQIFSTNDKTFVSLYHLVHSLLYSTSMRSLKHKFGSDGRMSELIRLRSINIIDLLLYLYPRMFVVDKIDGFMIVPLTKQSFAEGNCFLVHTFDRIYIWISNNVNIDFLENTFDVNEISKVKMEIPNLDTNENRNLRNLINDCWNLSAKYLQVEIILQGDKREEIFSELLKDEDLGGGPQLEKWIKAIKSI